MDSDSELVSMKCLPQYQAFAKLFFRACAILKTFFLSCGHQGLAVIMAVKNLSPPTQVSSYFYSQEHTLSYHHSELSKCPKTFMLYLIPGGESSVF